MNKLFALSGIVLITGLSLAGCGTSSTANGKTVITVATVNNSQTYMIG